MVDEYNLPRRDPRRKEEAYRLIRLIRSKTGGSSVVIYFEMRGRCGMMAVGFDVRRGTARLRLRLRLRLGDVPLCGEVYLCGK